MNMRMAVLVGLGLAMGLAQAIPLPEHPRPDWERAQWLNLNGEWDFGFAADKLNQKILVPFGWGSPASGVKDAGDTGYYRRSVTVPAEWKGKRVFVVIGAADHDTTCTFAGNELGQHVGGYTPFEYELTEFVTWGEPQELAFKVWDPNDETAREGHYLYGKQGYGNARGIWQTVYLEARGKDFVDVAWCHPSIADKRVGIGINLAAPAKKELPVKVTVDGQTQTVLVPAGDMRTHVFVNLPEPHLWTLDDPYLYDVKIETGDDVVKTYFGFREIGTGQTPNGDNYVTLNGKPIYLQMCLDQSYHPEGWYTFPSDEVMKNEILISKNLALSGNRVHIKVEVPRKLYWADKLGVLIQADVPCAWGDASEAMFDEHWKCFTDMVRRDFNHPSIYQWTLFNETWGLFSNRSLAMGLASGSGGKKRTYREWTQRAVAAAYEKAKAVDPMRIIEDNSPCNRDHVVTDVNTWHGYRPGFRWEETVANHCKDTFVGSTKNYVGGHVQRGEPMMNSECGNVWGYAGSTGDCDFTWDYHMMMNAFRRHLKCAGWLYTEHHDVCNEWNGYVRFDRSAKIFGIGELFPGMDLKSLHADAYLPLDVELYREAAPGATLTVPVDISLVTDTYAGETLALAYYLRYFDGAGQLLESPPVAVALADATAKSWQTGRLADVAVALPTGAACGTVNFTLMANGQAIARNFQCFATTGRTGATAPTKAEWSVKSWTARGGLKHNGAGTGFFEYAFDAPTGKCVFRAEVSAKRLNGKDRDDGAKVGTLDYMLGGGSFDRSKNPNSYPQTSEKGAYPGKVAVYANGTLVKTVSLADDPADHRGILSWGHQSRTSEPGKKGVRLDEAGSYGYLVEAEIPESIVKASADGKLIIRLAAEETGLAVYGPDFGRYPFGPYVTAQK